MERQWVPGRLVLTLLLAIVAAPWVGLGASVRAQATIDCATPVVAAASPAATPFPLPPADATFPAGGGDLTVFAAASLTDAFTRAGADLEASHPGLRITFNFAGSQALVTQLAEGASADVLATASTGAMANAVGAGVIGGEPQLFAGNQLVIIAPADNPAGIAGLADLGVDGVKLVVAGAEVPAGQYARAAICAAAGDVAAYGAGFPDRVAANIVSEEENVRSVVAKVELGEADAGIAYASDVVTAGEDGVTVIPFPDGIPVTASYPIAPVAGGDPALADAFIAWILSPAGQAVLANAGFLPKP